MASHSSLFRFTLYSLAPPPVLEDDYNIYWRSKLDNGPNEEPIPLGRDDGFVIMDYDGNTVATGTVAMFQE